MRKILVSAVLAGAMLIGQAGVASAGPVTVTANITAGGIGLRSLTSTPAIALTSLAGDATLNGSFLVEVTEAAVTGKNPWSVTAAMSSMSDGTNSITADNLSAESVQTTQVAGGGTSDNDVANGDFSTTRTLHTTSGQSATAVYTGLYTIEGDLSLEVPNGQESGLYTGTMTITLVQ